MWGRNCATPVLSWCDYPGKQHVRANSAVRAYSQMASAVGSLQLSIALKTAEVFDAPLSPRAASAEGSRKEHTLIMIKKEKCDTLWPLQVCVWQGGVLKGASLAAAGRPGKKNNVEKKVAGTMLFQYKVRLEVASICDKGYCDIYYSNVFIMWIAICPWPNSN